MTTYDFQLATITSGAHSGSDVAVLSEDDNGICACEFGNSESNTLTYIPKSYLRFWRSVNTVIIKNGVVIKAE